MGGSGPALVLAMALVSAPLPAGADGSHLLAYAENPGYNEINPGSAKTATINGLRLKPNAFLVTQRGGLDTDVALSAALAEVRAAPIGRIGFNDIRSGFTDPVLPRFLIRAPPGRLFETIQKFYDETNQGFLPSPQKTEPNRGFAPFLESQISQIANDPFLTPVERSVRLWRVVDSLAVVTAFRKFVPVEEGFVEEIPGEIMRLLSS